MKKLLVMMILTITVAGTPINTYAKDNTAIEQMTMAKSSNKEKSNIDYSAVFDATYYKNAYPDLALAGITTDKQLLNHFINNGMKEGRQGNEEFNVQAYKARYADLQAVYGNDLTKYYLHYITSGKAEGRNGRAAGNTTNNTTTKASTTVNGIPLLVWDVAMHPNHNEYMTLFRWNGSIYVAEGYPTVTKTYAEIAASPYSKVTSEEEIAANIAKANAAQKARNNRNLDPNVAADKQENVSPEEAARIFFDGINEYRVSQGLNPLRWDDTLAYYSTMRASEIVNCWGHMRPDGSQSISILPNNARDYGMISEEIRKSSYVSKNFNSSGHKRIASTPEYTRMGVGCVYVDGMYYYSMFLTVD